jgi:hypothetical protein
MKKLQSLVAVLGVSLLSAALPACNSSDDNSNEDLMNPSATTIPSDSQHVQSSGSTLYVTNSHNMTVVSEFNVADFKVSSHFITIKRNDGTGYVRDSVGNELMKEDDISQIGASDHLAGILTHSGSMRIVDSKGMWVKNERAVSDLIVTAGFAAYLTSAGEVAVVDNNADTVYKDAGVRRLMATDGTVVVQKTSGLVDLVAADGTRRSLSQLDEISAGQNQIAYRQGSHGVLLNSSGVQTRSFDNLAALKISDSFLGYLTTDGNATITPVNGSPITVSDVESLKISKIYAAYKTKTEAGAIYLPNGLALMKFSPGTSGGITRLEVSDIGAAYMTQDGSGQVFAKNGTPLMQSHASFADIDVSESFEASLSKDGSLSVYDSEGNVLIGETHVTSIQMSDAFVGYRNTYGDGAIFNSRRNAQAYFSKELRDLQIVGDHAASLTDRGELEVWAKGDNHLILTADDANWMLLLPNSISYIANGTLSTRNF